MLYTEGAKAPFGFISKGEKNECTNSTGYGKKRSIFRDK